MNKPDTQKNKKAIIVVRSPSRLPPIFTLATNVLKFAVPLLTICLTFYTTYLSPSLRSIKFLNNPLHLFFIGFAGGKLLAHLIDRTIANIIKKISCPSGANETCRIIKLQINNFCIGALKHLKCNREFGMLYIDEQELSFIDDGTYFLASYENIILYKSKKLPPENRHTLAIDNTTDGKRLDAKITLLQQYFWENRNKNTKNIKENIYMRIEHWKGERDDK